MYALTLCSGWKGEIQTHGSPSYAVVFDLMFQSSVCNWLKNQAMTSVRCNIVTYSGISLFVPVHHLSFMRILRHTGFGAECQWISSIANFQSSCTRLSTSQLHCPVLGSTIALGETRWSKTLSMSMAIEFTDGSKQWY